MQFEYEPMNLYLPVAQSNVIQIRGFDQRWRFIEAQPYKHSYNLKIEDAIISPQIYDILFLKANLGMGDKAIARALGISLDTKHRAIKDAIKTNIDVIPGMTDSSRPVMVLLTRLASWGLLEDSTKNKLTAPESRFLTKS